ncbi:MAG TPA: DegT/DnrJ/EryC1/StrS family aminotransferase [Caulobacteraceae bacterium]
MARPWLPSADEVLPYLRQADENRWYSNFGPLLTGFEARLAGRFERATKIVTAVNGTQVLSLTLRALEAPSGALCALPAWTFVATAHAVLEAGLVPWFLDVDPATQALDPDRVREALARAPGPVGAVVVVAPYGAALDTAAWLGFREETGVPVVIDAAAGFDTTTDAALPTMVSLHATKLLGVGEGGYLACEDTELADRVRELTTFGFRGSRESRVPATNAKLPEHTAAVGHAALDAWPALRLRYARTAQKLLMALASVPEVEMQPGWGLRWVSTTCVARLRSDGAARLERAATEAGVDTRRWWGGGCHTSPAFADLPREPLPVTDLLARETLGLPFAVDMSDEAVSRVGAAAVAALVTS